jgi:hypothetical protein
MTLPNGLSMTPAVHVCDDATLAGNNAPTVATVRGSADVAT